MNLQSEHTCCGFTEPRHHTMLPSISSFYLFLAPQFLLFPCGKISVFIFSDSPKQIAVPLLQSNKLWQQIYLSWVLNGIKIQFCPWFAHIDNDITWGHVILGCHVAGIKVRPRGLLGNLHDAQCAVVNAENLMHGRVISRERGTGQKLFFFRVDFFYSPWPQSRMIARLKICQSSWTIKNLVLYLAPVDCLQGFW